MMSYFVPAALVVFGLLMTAAPRAVWAFGTIAVWDQYSNFDEHRRASSPTLFGILAYRGLGIIMLALGLLLWITH